MMLPGITFFITRWVISGAVSSFQSKLSTFHWMGSMPMERMVRMALLS